MVYFTEAQERFCRTVRNFALEELAPGAMDRAKIDSISPEIINKLARGGFFKLTIPVKYGGEPKDSVSIGIVLEEICKVDISPMILFVSEFAVPSDYGVGP